MSKPEQKIIQYLDRLISKSKKFNMKDTILIAGSPRSGTSWLMEILGNIPGYTYLFEPLNPRWFPETRELGFQSRIYLPSDIDWSKGEEYLRKIFTGQLVGFQSLYQFTPKEIMHLLLGKKLIVKSVRLNRLLPWASRRFQLSKIFFIIRHPCAVITSQLKTGWCGYHSTFPPYSNIFPNLKTILYEASEIKSLDPELFNRLKNIKTREEILAVAWCLDNYVPLSSPKPFPWETIIYEKLVKQGEKEIVKLFNEIEEKDFLRYAIRYLKVPSALAPGDEPKTVIKANEQLSKWKKFLSEKQIERILSIVSDFGLDYYIEDLESDNDKSIN